MMISKPTLILNEQICRNNIRRMANKANQLKVSFRPHFKTHQSIEVGRWFRDYGIQKIAVSSVPMAKYFANDGWNDITIAFPFVFQQDDEINTLSKRINLNTTVSSVQNCEMLCKSITSRIGVYIEIDTGQNRSGLPHNDIKTIEQILKHLLACKNILFKGFISHAGQTYQANANSITGICSQATTQLAKLKHTFGNQFPNLEISFGDTPSSILCSSFEGVDELRPGNFAFFDMQQQSKGVCMPSDIAIALACPVVAVYPSQLKACIWGGAIHLSKDYYEDKKYGKSFGSICRLNPDFTWSEPIEGLFLKSISQEHGIIEATTPESIKQLNEGDIVAVLPAHSCLTADCMGEYLVNGKYKVKMLNK